MSNNNKKDQILDPIETGQVWLHKKQDSLHVVLALVSPSPGATGWSAKEKLVMFDVKANIITTKTVDQWFDTDFELWFDPILEDKIPLGTDVKNPKSRTGKIREAQGAAHPSNPDILLGGYAA